MANYFANGSRFRPPKSNAGEPVLESITGTLVSWDTRSGNSNSGKWLVIRINKDGNLINCFFDADSFVEADYDILEGLKNRTVTLSSDNGTPVINSINVKSDGSIRERLLEGVAAGRVNMDDLPALLEFAKGNDELYEKWNLFKKQIEVDGLERRKENITHWYSDYQKEIDDENEELRKLEEILKSVVSEKKRVLSELESGLALLQGEEQIEGNQYSFSVGRENENFIYIGTGYHAITDAFEKFKTQKGVYVVCEGKIHLIHHAYLEEKGRAFLIGESKEYMRTKPEKVKEIIDEIYEVQYGRKIHGK